MQLYRYNLLNSSKEDAEFLKEMAPYLSEHIESVSLNGSAVDIVYDGTTKEIIEDKFLNLISMLEMQSKSNSNMYPSTENIFESMDVVPMNASNIFPELLKHKQIFQLNTGSYALSGLLLQVKKYFELRIDELAKEVFGKSYAVLEMPDLIPISEYEKGGYFDTFPHHIMFAAELKNDINIIDSFSKKGLCSCFASKGLKEPKNVLRTAACMPLYPILRESKFGQNDPGAFVVSGRCFRNEEANVKGLERLNEFTMKELVLIGDSRQINEFVANASSIWHTWQEIFNLNMRIDTANDSFFVNNYRALKLFQLLGNSKRECRLLIPCSDSYLACSSANFHRTHFTKTYGIRMEESGKLCHSACVAFGLERLSYALLSQLGLDVRKWPNTARMEIERLVNLSDEHE